MAKRIRLIARQGDVLFMPIDKLPVGEHKKRKDGAVAYGEATGHSHTVMSDETASVFEVGRDVFLCVNERGVAIDGDIARLLPELHSIVADSAETEFRRERATELLGLLPTAGAVFLHGTAEERAVRPIPAKGEDRHFPTALAPGSYQVPTQREYTPEAIRNVID